MYDTQDIETLRSAIYEGNNNFWVIISNEGKIKV